MCRNKFEAFNYRCAVSVDKNFALLCLCPPRSIKVTYWWAIQRGVGGMGGREVFILKCYVRETGLT